MTRTKKLPTSYFFLLLISFSIISNISGSVNGSSVSSGSQCISDAKQHLALIAIHEPASLLQIFDKANNVQECIDMCCSGSVHINVNKECNAVSFYASGTRFLCVLLSCHPFDKCSWKPTAQNFVAVHVKPNRTAILEASVATTTTTTTATTVTKTTTTTVTTTTAATTTTTTRVPIAVAVVPLLTVPQAVDKEDAPPIWNIVAEQPATESATTTTVNTPAHLHRPEASTTPIYDSNNRPANQETPPKKQFVEAPREGQPTFWVTKNIYALIGVACFLCFLVLFLAIVFKKYQFKQGKPLYRQLRDYDVRVEPPASGAALLAA